MWGGREREQDRRGGKIWAEENTDKRMNEWKGDKEKGRTHTKAQKWEKKCNKVTTDERQGRGQTGKEDSLNWYST
jgi:hypothetical protein